MENKTLSKLTNQSTNEHGDRWFTDKKNVVQFTELVLSDVLKVFNKIKNSKIEGEEITSQELSVELRKHFKLEEKQKMPKEKPYKLNDDEYYDVRLNSHKADIPKLALQIYNWASDFRDRRGIRQTWDHSMDEKDAARFYNKIYKLLNGKVVTTKEINLITEELLNIPGMRQEWEQIDDDILEEIKNTWLENFSK